jgi:integrase
MCRGNKAQHQGTLDGGGHKTRSRQHLALDAHKGQRLTPSMGQASVLTDSDTRRVFRIFETTRHVERNRLAFVLSIYAGLRVGEIAALTVGDVATQSGDVRREIKLGAHQTKGLKGRTVILSERVRKELVCNP